MTFKEKAREPQKVIYAFAWVVAGIAVYNFIVVPLLSDQNYWNVVQERALHNFMPYALICVVMAAIWIVAIKLVGRRGK